MPQRLSPILLLVLLLSACGGGLPQPADGPGAPGAAAAVDRFLRLADAGDYVQMGWVFGTERGAVIEQWERPEVERRMYALASLIEHESFVLGAGEPVPGRIGRATRFQATLQQGNRQVTVPIIAVLGPGQRWFVEQVALEAVTNVR